MRRSLASIAGILVAVSFLIGSQTAVRAQSFAHQDVTVLVKPIVAVAVQDTNLPEEPVTLQYDLTTNVRGAVLEAALRSSHCSSTSITVTARTNHGASRGAVVVRCGESAVPVVTDIEPGLENGQRITISLDDEAPGDLTLALTLRDPGSGASQTVETGL